MKKTHTTVKVTVLLVIHAPEDQDIEQVLQDMNYSFQASNTTNAKIVDTEITEWEIK